MDELKNKIIRLLSGQIVSDDELGETLANKEAIADQIISLFTSNLDKDSEIPGFLGSKSYPGEYKIGGK